MTAALIAWVLVSIGVALLFGAMVVYAAGPDEARRRLCQALGHALCDCPGCLDARAGSGGWTVCRRCHSRVWVNEK